MKLETRQIVKNRVNRICFISAVVAMFLISNYVFSALAYTVESSDTGTILVENDTIVIHPYESKMVKISGNVTDVGSRDRIILTYIFPDGTKNGDEVLSTKKGYFETFLILDDKSPKGVYEILGLHETKIIGTVSFSLVGNQTSSVLSQITNQTEPVQTDVAITPNLNLIEFCSDGYQTLEIVMDEIGNNTSIKLHCIQEQRTFSITVIDNEMAILNNIDMNEGILNAFYGLENQTDIRTEGDLHEINILNNNSSVHDDLQLVEAKNSLNIDDENKMLGACLRPMEI